MTDKVHVSIRIPPDINEEFEQWREERNLSKSDAGRRLFENALRDESAESETQRATGPVLPILARAATDGAFTALLLGTVFAALAVYLPSGLPTLTATVLTLIVWGAGLLAGLTGFVLWVTVRYRRSAGDAAESGGGDVAQ